MGKVSKEKLDNKKPIRVLQIGMHDKIGGVEIFLMNYYSSLDRDKIQFDFINPYEHLCFEEEINAMGGKIYKVSNFKKHPLKYYRELKGIIKKYDIVHVNMLSAANILPIIISSRLKVKHIIAHSHNNGIPNGIFRKILNNLNKKILVKKATNFLACSESAGKWMFGEQRFNVVNNCIDLEKFKYNEEVRKKIRKEYNLDDKFVIGHVGRFEEQKNHLFIIDFFKEVLAKDENVRLLLIGDGILKNDIINKAVELKIDNKILFLGNKNNPEDFYCAMDLFILPSKFEGLGIVNVEAQASGLPCIVSDAVPEEVSLSSYFYRSNLNDMNDWIKKIKEIKKIKMNRIKNIQTTDLSKYDIKTNSILLENFYRNLNSKKKILVLTPGVLPVPAYNGGAVENLIQSYLDYNEELKKFNFFVYTISEDIENKYNETKFIKVNRNIVFKISRILRYLINNKLPIIYIGNAYTKKVLRLLKKDNRKYDVIIVENTPFMGIELRKIFKNTPIILHLHNDYLNYKTKRAKECLNSYDKIIAISKYIKNRIDKIENTNKVVVVYNGIDIGIFKEEIDDSILDDYKKKYNIKKNDIVLLYTGRLVAEKGLTELINVSIKLVENNYNIKLLVVGGKKNNKPSEQGYINDLERIASKYSKNIIFTDYVEYKKLPVFHNISNIQIIPSKCGEALGNVVIEGMASGIKQIITNDGGMTEIINDSVSVIELNNLEKNLYEEVVKIINSKKYAKRYTTNVDKFSEQSYSQQIFDVIEGEKNEN